MLNRTPNDLSIQTTLRDTPLDKLEKLGEMRAELKSNNDAPNGFES